MDIVWANRFIFILSIAGLMISGYLFYTYVTASPIVCVNTGCEEVRSSPYSSFFGVPLPFYGGVMYLAVFLFSFGKTFARKSRVKKLSVAIFLFASVGLATSAHLTYLEIFVIKAICIWCAASAVVITLIFLLSFWQLKSIKDEIKR